MHKLIEFIDLHQKSLQKILTDICIILALTLFQSIWISFFVSLRVGLLNFLPTGIFLSIWCLFIKTELQQKYFWYYLILGFILTLRLPLTISRQLEPLNWITYFCIIGLFLYKILIYYKQRQQLALLLVTSLIILFNSLNHVSINSPSTYVLKAVKNQKYECPHESPTFMVSCDLPHHIAEEKIFTDPKFDASFSVLLRRYFYGFLSSLIGFDGHRWIASFTLNLMFWLFTCTALYKICILTKLGERVAAAVMLCGSSSWGFISFVGQPAMYLAAYAYSSIIIWATLEIINCHSCNQKKILLCLLILSGSCIYDIYPITLACLLVMVVYKNRAIAMTVLLVQLLLALLWKNIFLEKVLSTTGSQTNVEFATKSLNTWFNIITHLDLMRALNFVLKGALSYLYGGMIVGALASFIFIIFLIINLKINIQSRKFTISDSDSNKLLIWLSCSVCLLVLGSTVLVAPQTAEWSFTDLLPRLAFYTYPINTIALVVLGNWMIPKRLYIIPLLTFLIGNIDLTGIASVTAFFDLGLLGIYWK